MKINIYADGLLDRLPASARHYLIMFVAALLGWAADAVVGVKIADNPVLTGVLVAALTSAVAQLTMAWTKLTKQYGRGSVPAVDTAVLSVSDQ